MDLRKVRVERLRRFGDVLLALILWKRLRLDTFFRTVLTPGREEVSWGLMVCLQTIARFCEPSSELAVAESFYPKTALGDLLGLPTEGIDLFGAPRSMLKRCEQDLLTGSWEEVQPGVEVKEVHLETGSGERFLLCRSRARIEKDRAIVEKAASRLEAGLRKLQAQIASGRETYIGLTEAEAAFRELKSPLGLRPVYHQKEDRVEAHIFIAFLALCLRRSLALWMEKSGLGTAPQKLLKQLRQIHSLDVILTAKQNTEIRLRVVSTPGLPNRPKIIENVVATLDS